MNQIRLAQKRWSTYPLVFGCWLFDYVIYLNLQILANLQHTAVIL